MRILLPTFLGLLLAASTPAQLTRVVPAAAQSRDGSSSTAYFSGYGAGRAQQVVDGSALCKTSAVLRELALRADGARLRAIASRSFPRLVFSLGYTSATPASMSTTFSANRTGRQTQIFSGAYNLPAQNATTRPFNIVWKFPAPFIYTRATGNLLVEFEVPGQPTKSEYFLDAHRVQAGGGSCQTFGKQGPFSTNETYQTVCENARTIVPGGSATLIVAPFSKNYPAIAVWGFSNARYGPLPLPFELTPVGAPKNYLNVSIDLALPMPMTAGRGGWQGRSTLAIPNDKGLTNQTIYVQAMFADAAANRFGWVFSPGLAMTIAATNPAQLVGHYDYQMATGFRVTDTAMVMQFSGVFN